MKKSVTHTSLFVFILIWPALCSASSIDHDTNELIANFSATQAEKNAGAAVISKKISMHIQSNDHYEIEHYVLIAILSDNAARDYNKISIGYNSYFHDIELLFAHSIDQQGNIAKVSKDAVQIKNNTGAQTYNDTRELTFALPRLTKGSFLEYKYRTRIKQPIIPGYWYRSLFLQEYQPTQSSFRVDPTRVSTISISTPVAHSFQYKLENSTAEFNEETRGSKRIYTWTAKNIDRIVYEKDLPSLHDKWAFLRVSSITNWSMIDDWATDIYQSKAVANNAINLKAIAVTEPHNTAKEKIRALFYYMLENIHYISADVRRGGFIPHSASETWKNQYGDCKDQATLFVSMLRSLGIPAYPALVGVYPQIDVSADIPSLSFSHMIVYIPNIDGGLWVDTSSDWGTFPGVTWELENRNALVLDGKGGKLLKIKRYTNKVNELTVSNKFNFKGNNLSSSMKIEIKGDSGDRYKHYAKTSPDIENEIRTIIKNMYSRAENIDVDIFDNATQDKPFKILAHLDFGDASQAIQDQFSYSGSIAAILNSFTSISEPPNPDDRINDVLIGYKFNLNYSIEYAAPEPDYKPTITNSIYSLNNPYFNYKHDIDDSSGAVRVSSHFQLNKEVISSNSYHDYYKKIDALTREGQWLVEFKKDNNYLKEKKLKQQIKENNNNTDSKLELANHRISIGNYDEAVNLVEEVIAIDRTNGKAHYLLGLIYGYKNEFERSQQHFTKAEEYGYVP